MPLGVLVDVHAAEYTEERDPQDEEDGVPYEEDGDPGDEGDHIDDGGDC